MVDIVKQREHSPIYEAFVAILEILIPQCIAIVVRTPPEKYPCKGSCKRKSYETDRAE